MTTPRFLLTIAICLATSSTHAQESPTEVTDAQISLYQMGLELACKNSGRRRGDPPEKVEVFCSCASKTLKQNATRAEWQNAYFFNRKRLSREEKEALAAHLPQVESCKAAAQ